MNIIDSGYIRNNNDLKYYTYEIKLLKESHLQEIIDLHQRVLAHVNDWELCIPIALEEFQNMLSTQGMMLGVFVQNRLIAFRGILFPGASQDYLGDIVGLQKNHLNQIAYFEITNVHHEFNDNGLQKKTMIIALEILRQQNKYRHIFAITSPQNYASVKSLFSSNIILVGMKKMYEGCLRYIFYKDLANSIPLDLNNIQLVSTENIVAQKLLLKEGYAGFRLNKGYAPDTMFFAKRLDIQYKPFIYNMLG